MGTGTCWRCGASEDGALSSYGDHRDAEIAALKAERDAALAANAEMRAALLEAREVMTGMIGQEWADAWNAADTALSRPDLGAGMVAVERKVLERWRERLSTVLCCLHSTDHQAREMIVDARADLDALLKEGGG